MRSTLCVALASAVLGCSAILPAAADPPALSIAIPLRFGAHRTREPERPATAAEVRAEARLRLVRYGMQLADAIISSIGYRAYARCLSCLAYPGGGPLGARAMSVADFNGNRPAEVDPLIQPFTHGALLSLAFGTMAFDVIDARVEKRWPTERRVSADLAEIGAHAWGISTWLPEIKAIRRDTAVASACGAQWQAKRYGEAFSDGCVNAYYRQGAGPANALPDQRVMQVCAPARFERGTYLFATADDYIVSSGAPCSALPALP